MGLFGTSCSQLLETDSGHSVSSPSVSLFQFAEARFSALRN